MKHLIILLFFLQPFFYLNSQDSLSLLFIGDIMGHGGQIQSAYDSDTKSYNYDPVFERIKPVIERADFAIANIEVTFAGPPYSGYPQFSSPDALASSCKKNGIDVLVTANNHSCDRRTKGVIRTIHVLDSLHIPHTGTFRSALERKLNNLLILKKGAFRIGVLNYTYGTNGLKAAKPALVNYIDTTQILKDIKNSQSENLDQLIVITHWGLEYQTSPNKKQVKTANFLLRNGVDIVIGSHPHVMQKAEWHKDKNQIVAYSLGNFVSNQASINTDGGMMLELTLVKNDSTVKITNPGYHLIWVHKPTIKGKKVYEVIPCSLYESNEQNLRFMNSSHIKRMKLFMKNAREIMSANKGVSEIILN